MKNKKLSKLLKMLARIVGGFCIAYGLIVGVLGTGPDGQHGSLWLHLIGIYILLLGMAYFIPNQSLLPDNRKRKWYLIFTVSPVVFLVAGVFYTSVSEGVHSLFNQGVHFQFPIFLLVASFAPLSLMTDE